MELIFIHEFHDLTLVPRCAGIPLVEIHGVQRYFPHVGCVGFFWFFGRDEKFCFVLPVTILRYYVEINTEIRVSVFL
jgi:hypothetical protein